MERSRGWLRCARDQFEDPFWSEKPFGRWRARWDIVAFAAYSEHDRGASGRNIRLNRGEFLASVTYLAQRWGWTGGKVRVFLDLLLQRRFLEKVRRTSVGMIYRVTLYEFLVGDDKAQAVETSPLKQPSAELVTRSQKSFKPVGPPPDKEASPQARAAWEARVLARAEATLPAIPSELQTSEFKALWRERLIERAEKETKGRLSWTQVTSQFKKMLRLKELKGMPAVLACLERATEGGYAGVVFKEDLEVKRKRQTSNQQSLFEGNTHDDALIDLGRK